jgi:spermidine/putrescine transport system ATP-binding protein
MVELRSVTKRFGSFTAVDHVDLSVKAGEFLTLLGPSGCGKTTLLRMISGFEQPTEGTVHLDGKDVTSAPPYRRDVNQVFQSYALFPHLNVRDNVAFGLRMKRVPKAEMWQRVDQAIEQVSLTGMERRKPDQLSGGQRQRVALARAVVNRPRVLLLDEPLGALDAELRRAMQIELKRLQRSLGITFIFVTHDQEEALSMSDRIAVVNRGRIEQIDSAQMIYRNPATAFVARFLGGANVLTCEWLGDDPPRVRLADGGELTVPRSDAAAFISIRPERIRLVRHRPTDGANVFAVSVIEQIFRGATDQLLLRTPGGLELHAAADGGDWKKDDHAFVHIEPGDIVLIN